MALAGNCPPWASGPYGAPSLPWGGGNRRTYLRGLTCFEVTVPSLPLFRADGADAAARHGGGQSEQPGAARPQKRRRGPREGLEEGVTFREEARLRGTGSVGFGA